MSQLQRIVHLKQSGELLTDKPGERWTPTALRKAAQDIADVIAQSERLGVAGLMVISGGGNVPDGFGRGANTRKIFGDDSMVARYADVIGRRSTTDNAIMLTAMLMDIGVPCMLMAAPNAAFEDIELGPIPVYTPQIAQEAYRTGKVILIAGGSGQGGRTTDAAVVTYAKWQADAYPDIPSIALKATKYNGVYDNDPATHNDARQYAQLSADFMLSDYERFSAVDHVCLETLTEAGAAGVDVHLQVYAATNSVVQALEDEHLGTTIFSQHVEPTFA